jgi:mono/diheme cytochrome c family protein
MPPWSDTVNAGRTFLAIRKGVPQTAMPPWPTLSDQQIWQLVAYITSLKQAPYSRASRIAKQLL